MTLGCFLQHFNYFTLSTLKMLKKGVKFLVRVKSQLRNQLKQKRWKILWRAKRKMKFFMLLNTFATLILYFVNLEVYFWVIRSSTSLELLKRNSLDIFTDMASMIFWILQARWKCQLFTFALCWVNLKNTRNNIQAGIEKSLIYQWIL